ncbi:MAG: hypothetical protein FWE02_03670 [Defluviitaleaceae bacterium]|nr:hypothetical protein [Defluviitaleaceae bacterium]
MITNFNFESNNIRTTLIDNNPYFCALDIASTLGYLQPQHAISRHAKGCMNHTVLTNGGYQILKFIPEPDVYRLIIKSKLPSAEKFEKWVFEEVLPQIRKTGSYSTKQQEYVELLEGVKYPMDWLHHNANINSMYAETALNSLNEMEEIISAMKIKLLEISKISTNTKDTIKDKRFNTKLVNI